MVGGEGCVLPQPDDGLVLRCSLHVLVFVDEPKVQGLLRAVVFLDEPKVLVLACVAPALVGADQRQQDDEVLQGGGEAQDVHWQALLPQCVVHLVR